MYCQYVLFFSVLWLYVLLIHKRLKDSQHDHDSFCASDYLIIIVLNSIKHQQWDNLRAMVSHASYPDIYLILFLRDVLCRDFRNFSDIDIDWMIDILKYIIWINLVHLYLKVTTISLYF